MINTRIGFVTLAAILLLGGCAEEPPPREPAPLTHPAPPRVSAPRPGAPASPIRLTLEDVRARARSASEKVLEAEADVRRARAREEATFDEVAMPKLDLAGDYRRSSRRLVLETRGGDIELARRDLSDDVVMVTQPLLDVAGFFYKVGAERAATDAARAAAERAADLSELEATGAFYAALTRDEEAAAIESAIAALRQRVEDARNLQKAGQERFNEVTKVELDLARRRQELLATRNAKRKAQIELAASLALPTDARLDLVPPPVPPTPTAAPALPQLVERAMAHRADLRSLEAAERRLDEMDSALCAEYAPRLSAFADYRYDHDPDLREQSALEVGVALQWRLFDGFAREERRAEVRAERDAVSARHRATERRVAGDVERATLDLTLQRSALVVAAQSLEQARSSQSIQEQLYRKGRSTISELLEAEERVFESGVEVARARFGLLAAVEEMRAAMGGE